MITECTMKMEHCYGIRSLNYSFAFSDSGGSVVAIYAPNGSMKTSMAESLKRYSEGKDPEDRVNSNVIPKISVENQDGNEITKETIFVVDSFDEKFRSKKISTLLASDDLKKRYDEIFNNVENKRNALLKNLGKKFETTPARSAEILKKAFRRTDLNKALQSVDRDVKNDEYLDFSDASYKTLFNEKVINFLNSDPEIVSTISHHSSLYEQLLDKSRFFKKGIFSHTHAENVLKNLKSNKWFNGGHTVRLNAKDGSETGDIIDENALLECIEKEKKSILDNPEMRDMFKNADDKFTNADLQAFRDHLVEHPYLLSEISNMDELLFKVCAAYLSTMKSEYIEFLEMYDESKSKVDEIVEDADTDVTLWEKVIEEFNSRFSVPFEVRIGNKADAVLSITAPQIQFLIEDQDNKNVRQFESDDLFEILSTGEKRALYILNILFEIRARNIIGQETLVVFDDIADSFDYKNKYAIVEYLSDISTYEGFHIIILTHNYDFYRTIKSRLYVKEGSALVAERSGGNIVLKQDTIGNNPFSNWVDNLSDTKSMIGCIPFVRNIAEYSNNDAAFSKLTKLLHIMPGSKDITFKELKEIFGSVLRGKRIEDCENDDRKVIDVVLDTCVSISNLKMDEVDLLDKVVMSMGIRLIAEKVLIQEIGNENFVNRLGSNQTGELIKKFENMYKNNMKEKDQDKFKPYIDVMKRVRIMTPENIHMNSFMFEPILDMSPQHLWELHRDVSKLE